MEGTILCFSSFSNKDIVLNALCINNNDREPQFILEDSIEVYQAEFNENPIYYVVTRTPEGTNGQLKIIESVANNIKGRVLIIDRRLRQQDFILYGVDFKPNYYIIDNVDSLENGLETTLNDDQKRHVRNRVLPERQRRRSLAGPSVAAMLGNRFRTRQSHVLDMITAATNQNSYGTTVHFIPVPVDMGSGLLEGGTLDHVLQASFNFPQPAQGTKRTLDDVWKEQVEKHDESAEKRVNATCVVCMDKPACMVFVPCGCIAACQSCVKTNWEMSDTNHNCFLCRELVSMPIHISQWESMQNKIEKHIIKK